MGIFETLAKKISGGNSEDGKKIEDPIDQSDDEIKLVTFVKNKLDKARTQANRIAHEGVWMTNIAYLLGFDGVYYDTQSKQFKPIQRAQNTMSRSRVHSNKLLPMAQNKCSRLCKNPPRYDVLPVSKDEEDREGARLGLEILNNFWDKLQINTKRIELEMWLLQMGHSYMKVSYDSQLGEPMVDPLTGELEDYEGDIRADVVSGFEMFPDPDAKCFDDLHWLIQAKVRTLDYFKSHYPERGDAVKEEGAWLLSLQYESRIKSINTQGPGASGNLQSVMENSAVEISYYEKRSIKHPKGRLVVIANGVLLQDDKLPVGEIPFVKFDDIVIGGKYYSESTITHARPLQDQYNRTLSRRAEWTNKMLAGKYLAAKGHGITKESLNDRSGEVVQYNNVPNCPPPAHMDIPLIPQYAYNETTELEKEMAQMFGLSEVSRGILPSAGIPAIGMQLLLEQDETRIGIEVEQHENSWARLGKLILLYVATCFKTTRKLKKRGANNEYDIREFVGQDLRGNTDVMVVRGSTVPNSKLMKRQEILNTYTQGLLGDPSDPAVREKVLGMLEFGDLSDVWRDEALDKAQIQKGIKEIETGLDPKVDKLDNHMMWILELNRFRKSDKGQALPSQNLQILMGTIEAHVHEQMLIQNPGLANPPQPPMQPPPMAPEGIAQNSEMPQNGLIGP